MLCDMCGSEKNLREAVVEGSLMTVCEDCAKYGKIVRKKEVKREEPVIAKDMRMPFVVPKSVPEEEEIEEVISKGFGRKIKAKREELGMKQEELAKRLNMKVSLLQKIETESFEPRLVTAKKIEKFLHLNLIKKEKMTGNIYAPDKYAEPATVGSMIEFSSRKK